MTSSRHATLILTKSGPLRLYSTTELLTLQPPQWLVHGILPVGGFIGVYGDSYTGKSYLAIDLAMCIASGHPWHGHAVVPGFVVYIVAEGGHGVRKRAQAWCTLHGISSYKPDMGWLLQSIPIHPASEEMDILCSRLSDELESRPVLIVIDTLARCFAGGDENQQEDMGQFVAGVDRLRTAYGAAVIAVHHTRVANDRERGSTAFRGAADTMILVDKPRPEHLWIKCTKQKDFDEFEPIELAFHKVEGAIPELNSATLVTVGERTLTTTKHMILASLAHESRTFTELRSHGNSEIPKSSLARGLAGLLKTRQIVKENGAYTLPYRQKEP